MQSRKIALRDPGPIKTSEHIELGGCDYRTKAIEEQSGKAVGNANDLLKRIIDVVIRRNRYSLGALRSVVSMRDSLIGKCANFLDCGMSQVVLRRDQNRRLDPVRTLSPRRISTKFVERFMH